MSKIASLAGRIDDDELFSPAADRRDGPADFSAPPRIEDQAQTEECLRCPLVGLWLLACIVVQTALSTSSSSHIYTLWLGTIWGGCSGTLWLLSAVKNPLIKVCLTVGACAWPAVYLAIYGGGSFIFYVAMVGFMGLLQGTLFRAAGVPRWQRRPWRLSMNDRRQFQIGDLVLLTAAAAVVFAAVRATGNDDTAFWAGLAGVQCGMALTATVLIKSQLQRCRRIRQAMLFAAGIMAAALAGGMALAESVYWQTAGPTREDFQLYGNLLGAYAVWMFLLVGGVQRAAAEPNDRGVLTDQSPAA